MPRKKARQRDRMSAKTGVRRSKYTSNTTPASSSSIQPSHHHVPLSNDHLYGAIMWLPPENEQLLINQPPYVKSTGELCGLETGCYDHPVLVLSPVPGSLFPVITSTGLGNQANQKVTILMITSFRGKDILERFPSPSNAKQRRTYLPISPADQHPDLVDIPVLRLAGGLEMAKKCYVDTMQKHEVPRQALRQYRMYGNKRGGGGVDFYGLRYVLARESYLIVAQQAGYSIPTISVSVSVPIPVSLPSPPPSPSTPRTIQVQVAPPPSTVAQGLGVTNSTCGMFTDFSSTAPRPQIASTLLKNLQAKRAQPHALDPGTRLPATRTEVAPLLPTHVYQSDARFGKRSGSPSAAAQRIGLPNSSREVFSDFSSNAPRPQTASTLFENFQAGRVRPDALNPGRGIRVATTRTEVPPLLPTHVYQSDGRVAGRSGSPYRRQRARYYHVDGAPSHSRSRDDLIVMLVGLAVLAGIGCGAWVAWRYRGALGGSL